LRRTSRRRTLRHRTPCHRTLALLAVLTLFVGACAGDDGGAADAPDPEPETTVGDADADGTEEPADETDEPETTSAPEGEVATSEPVASGGCGSSTVGLLESERLEVDADRYYLLTTPEDHDGENPVPLVLDFHGLTEGAEVHAGHSALGPYAQENGFVVAFPHGSGEPVGWQTAADRTGNDDLVYVDEVLDQLEEDLCVDTSRVYATGLSNGALLSSTIACTMDDRFAAVAPVAGITATEPCEADRPVPVHGFHGTDDPILLFNGGVNLDVLGGGDDEGEDDELPEPDLDGEGYPANAAAWAERNGCEDDPVDEERTDTVLRRSWDCPPGAEVVFDIIDGHGHGWPGSDFSVAIEAAIGPNDMSIDANEEMWRFFERFALPAD
jgi:polyhydroxybutyrate depolymerase